MGQVCPLSGQLELGYKESRDMTVVRCSQPQLELEKALVSSIVFQPAEEGAPVSDLVTVGACPE